MKFFDGSLNTALLIMKYSSKKNAANEEIQAFIALSKLQAIPTGSVPRWYESLHQINRKLATTTTMKSGSP